MYPILLNIGNFPIHSYGFLIATGFLLCVWQSKREGQRLGISGEKLVDLGFWCLLVGMIACRILYIITRWDYYLQHPIETLYVWEGGLVFWAGPLLNIPFFMWYTKRHKMPRWAVIDIGAQAVPLAHAFGRLGCFSAGCCYGLPTDLPWGVQFSSELVDAHMRGLHLHPTQLYESAGLFVLWFILRRMRFRKKFDGHLLVIYLIGYSILRSIIETFRGDTIRGFVIDGILSTSQFISLIVVCVTLIFYLKKRKEACQASLVSA